MRLYQTPARALDKFVQDNLLPQKDFLDQMSQAVNTICKVLREKGFQNGTSKGQVMRVIKGGSYGRGTALRDGTDADLVVFLSCFKTYADQGAWKSENFTDIQKQLEAHWQNQPQGWSLQFSSQEDPLALRFRLVSEPLHRWMDVSLRPAFDALGQLGSNSKPSPKVYADLISCHSPAGTYAACFMELRRLFVNSRPPKLKNLILLVKHWYLLVKEAHQAELQSAKISLPPDYALELLTIFAWERGCGKEKFNMTEGFRTVLGLIQKYQELCVYWEVNYSLEDEVVGAFLQNQLKKPRPVILDPADPTWDVGHRHKQHWDLLAHEAGSSLSYPCFVQRDGSPVQPWDVLGLLTPGTETKVEDPVEKERSAPRSNSSSADTIPKCPGSSNRESPKGKPDPDRTTKNMHANRTDMEIYHIPAKDLDKFIQDVLQPDTGFQEQMGKVIDTIFRCLREKCFQASSPPIRVLKVSKGGSYGWGTALRGGTDADLIVYLSCFKTYADQGTWQSVSFTEIQEQLEACLQDLPQGLNLQFSAQEDPLALRFQLVSVPLQSWMDVSLRPAFDALGQLRSNSKPSPKVYADLISCSSPAGAYTACFMELRRLFINNRPRKLKNLILLVKHWYLLVKEAHQAELQSAKISLPPDYALELLTIFAWERGCGKEKFNMTEGFRTVLGLIQKYQELCVYWEVNYSLEDEVVGAFLQNQLKKPRPVILDPADPTWDVGHRHKQHWDLLAHEAGSSLSYPCFVQRDGSPVQPWDVLGLLTPGTEAKVKVPVEKKRGAPKSNDSSANTIPKCPGSSNSELPKGQPDPDRTTKDVHPNRTDMEIYHIPAKDLDKFIQDVLQPDAGFQEQMSKVIDTIFRCLREKCFQASSPPIRVLKVSKGGSYGRGTALKGGTDADLIMFLSCFKTYADQGTWRSMNFTEIREQLEACLQDLPQGLSLQFSAQQDPLALRFQLVSVPLQSWMDVSLRPAFDALGYRQDGIMKEILELDPSPLTPGSKHKPQVYVELISSGFPGGSHSECFNELQRDFVNSRPSKLKNLILLVKHWYQQVSSWTGQDECLPPVYALELLTIYAWEQAGKKNKFHMAEGFLTVLGLIQDHQHLCIYWTVNYDFEDKVIRSCLQKHLRKPRPLILDPADPTCNVGQGNWERLAREAETCRCHPCFVNGDGSPVQPWDVMPALLQQTPSWDLENFISKFLQPNKEFLNQVSKAVDIICSFLKENCFRNSSTKVLKVVKGGSSAKGTALKGRSDADIVVFLSCFHAFTDQGTNRAEIIKEIREQLEACRRKKQFEVKFEISKWENPRVLSFTLKSKTLDHSVDFDVLPAFDALGQLGSDTKPKPQVYIDLINSYNNGGEFSSCFTELQRNFVISRPTKLKSLIRLVKHWYKQCMRFPNGRGPLPPQYALELLTIYAWEQRGGTAQFDMGEGFRTVLQLVQNYKNLCIHWKVNYDSENEIIKNFLTQQLQKPRPIILDPADPTGNLGHGARWDLLAKEAASYANSVCCANKSGDLIQPWAFEVSS